VKELNTVIIRVFHKCARCGQEEEPEIIKRAIEEPVKIDESRDRVTVELVYDPDNDEYAPDIKGEMKIVEKR